MRGGLVVFLLLQGFISVIANTKLGGLVWSQSYFVQGTLHIPYAEIAEPFLAWFDGPTRRSRIDYYDGMVKTYQLGKDGYGTSIKIAPVTTETQQNVETCFQVNGTAENKILPQSILPDLTNFEYIGKETLGDLETDKWRLVERVGEKQNNYTMWVINNINDGTFVTIPIKYEMNGYNTLLGSHYDHYYLEYNSFTIYDVYEETFEIDANLTCRSFFGPGDKHIYTFNPMAEFVKPETTGHLDSAFDEFTRKHNKQYEGQTEHLLRKEIFRQNIRFIHSVNRQNKGYSLSVNHLADKTPQELKALRGRQYSEVYNGGQPFPYENINRDDLPPQFDWRTHGAVTPVKDQSVCGSCWSFGAIGAVEGALFLKNGGKLVSLSQQALVDCSWGYGNNGCDGGEDFRAYSWIKKHGGVPTEKDYGPYLGQDGYCHADKVSKVAPIKGWVNVTSNDENALRLAIFKHGPISVAIDASHRTFSFYSNGVYNEPKCGNKAEELDHAVLAVGYGSLNGEDYWLIKNSWSTYWGNDGYILMAAKDNNCGVLTTPTYVTM